MSHMHIRKMKTASEPVRVKWWPVWLGGAGLLVLILGLSFLLNWWRSTQEFFATTTGKILETRQVVDRTYNSQYGGGIGYRYEARVQYMVDGKSQDRWLTISDRMSRDVLLVRLVEHPTECTVYWRPEDPDYVRCWLK